MDASHQDLMLSFCSLGQNCEFGQAQRLAGAEPIDLLRWGNTPIKVVMELLERRFEGLGDADKIAVHEHVESGQIMVRSLAYNFRWHAWATLKDTTLEAVHEREVRRIPFVVRKLIEDIEAGDRIFVIKRESSPIHRDGARYVRDLMRRYGGKPAVLYVSPGGPPSVEVEEPGLLRGTIPSFCTPGKLIDTTPTDAWIEMCMRARQAVG